MSTDIPERFQKRPKILSLAFFVFPFPIRHAIQRAQASLLERLRSQGRDRDSRLFRSRPGADRLRPAGCVQRPRTVPGAIPRTGLCAPGDHLHHAANPQIDYQDPDNAQARWALHYQNRDAETGVTRQLGGFYQDCYRREAGQWRIVETVFRGHFEVVRPKPGPISPWS
ncbi:nuclear transport factor 2 family protein [Pseudomonas guariconensis]|uniref:nuclear transport factor 2 family protein n=1 Tax=Pseudomonas guariconensis TaxID=1288410 RepID=UPI00384B8A05